MGNEALIDLVSSFMRMERADVEVLDRGSGRIAGRCRLSSSSRSWM
jgi:hypothetical protein